jgi:hypothetical protein
MISKHCTGSVRDIPLRMFSGKQNNGKYNDILNPITLASGQSLGDIRIYKFQKTGFYYVAEFSFT